MQVRELKIQRKNPGHALGFCPIWIYLLLGICRYPSCLQELPTPDLGVSQSPQLALFFFFKIKFGQMLVQENFFPGL